MHARGKQRRQFHRAHGRRVEALVTDRVVRRQGQFQPAMRGAIRDHLVGAVAAAVEHHIGVQAEAGACGSSMRVRAISMSLRTTTICASALLMITDSGPAGDNSGLRW